MGLELKSVVPWGRCFDEYRRMFELSDADLARTLLDCGGGPASFNTEMTQRGYTITSCDPIYQFSAVEIAQRIDATYATIISGVLENLDHYVWREIPNPEVLGKVRMAAMTQFLADFPTGLAAGRYQVAALPNLPFADHQFDLALCSHLLFTYSDQLSLAFHLEAIESLCRVASEVRIFPLLRLDGEASPWLPPILDRLQTQNLEYEVRITAYEFQMGGNQLLKIFSGNRGKA
ncbi:MAG: SAM-dependent methyltransferase [Cyanobacteria bacterium P01_A01_bin.123]